MRVMTIGLYLGLMLAAFSSCSDESGGEGESCTDECTAADGPRCVGAGFESCAKKSNGCYAWSGAQACPAETTCEAGACVGCPGGCCPQCDGTTCGSDACGGTCACTGAASLCNSANMCCTPENGASCCDRQITAMCERIVTCCSAAGAGACSSWAYDVNSCKGEYVTLGYNCAAMSDSTCCEEATSRCVSDIPIVACTDIIAGTAYFPASCATDTF